MHRLTTIGLVGLLTACCTDKPHFAQDYDKLYIPEGCEYSKRVHQQHRSVHAVGKSIYYRDINEMIVCDKDYEPATNPLPKLNN